MPRYFFNLKTHDKIIRDTEGTELPDENSARAHAHDVACELVANRKMKETRLWRLSVRNEQDSSHFELLLALVCPAMSDLSPDMRQSVEDVCRKTAALNDAIKQVRISLY